MFGKMLKKAPYMLHLDSPSTAEEKRNAISRVEQRNTATSSNHIACNALRILQLLSSLDLPDLDKVVRTQPLLLLADIQEVNARIDFLFALCNEIKPFQVNRASPPEYTSLHERVDSSSSSKSRDLSSNLDNPSCVMKDRVGISTPPVSLTSSPLNVQSVDSRTEFSRLEIEAGAVPIAVTCENRKLMELVGDSGVGRHISFPPSNSRQPATAPQAACMGSDRSLSQEGEVEVELTPRNVDSSTVTSISSRRASSEVAVESRHQEIAALSKDAFESNQEAARKILGSLLLSYPGVLSIESRYELLYLFTAHLRRPAKPPLTLYRHHVNYFCALIGR